jgi:ankyrin repeat protein
LELGAECVAPGLCIAVYIRCDTLVRFFLDNGADINATWLGHNPLDWALEAGDEMWAMMFIEKGALPGGHGSVHLREPLLLRATKRGWATTVDLLLQRGADPNLADAAGNTPLLIAAELRNAKIMKLLIQRDANIHSADAVGNTMLHVSIAANRGDASVVDLLIRSGANVNLANALGDTPLSIAAKLGDASIVALLIRSGANVNLAIDAGDTPPSIAAAHTNAPVTKLLTRNGASLNEQIREDWAPLHIIASKRLHECLRLAIDACGTDPNIATRCGQTPLHLLVKQQDTAGLSIFLDAPGILVDKKDNEGKTPLSIAVGSGIPRAVKLLLDNDADPNILAGDFTPFGTAIHKMDEAILKIILDSGRIRSNVCHSLRILPLYGLVKTADVQTLQLLLESNRFDPNEPKCFFRSQSGIPLLVLLSLGTWRSEMPWLKPCILCDVNSV